MMSAEQNLETELRVTRIGPDWQVDLKWPHHRKLPTTRAHTTDNRPPPGLCALCQIGHGSVEPPWVHDRQALH